MPDTRSAGPVRHRRGTPVVAGLVVAGLAAAGLVAAGLAGGSVVAAVPEVSAGAASSGRAAVPVRPRPGVSWLSGASGPTVEDGTFEEWRGEPVGVVGTWSDTNADMVGLWQLRDGAELGDYDGPLDIAVGAIGPGESWSGAAAGAYDDRWRASLQALAEARAGARGPTFVRFAHEFNGDWYDWRVEADEVEDFVAAWRRYHHLQEEHFPQARLVFNVNRESVGTGFDWREAFPGADHVDVFSVDYYNQFPFVRTVADWERTVVEYDAHGAPKGLQRHLEFARENGLPLAVSEWSSNASMGDSPVFVEQMHGFFARHGDRGTGELLYEIHFNIVEGDDNPWALWPRTRMPEAADAYRRLW